MTALECLRDARASGGHFRGSINAFVDGFRRAPVADEARLIAEPITASGELEDLVAGKVSALCREAGVAAPAWLEHVHSPTPFFAFLARGFALRVRLMLESPAPFKVRKVFVPESFLSRA